MNTRSRSRRSFLKQSSITTAGLAFPQILTAQKTGDQKVLGPEGHRYEVQHDCVQLPERYHWQTTHNVAVDKDQNLYVTHEGKKGVDHPTIFVFDPDGKFIRAFGAQLRGGGHGIEIRTEGSEQFIYASAYQHVKRFVKLTLTGETVWERRAPMETGRYAKGEDKSNEAKWGRNRFMPTNVAFHPSDGSFYVADGYGAHCIHRYDKDANYMSTIGKPGKKDGEFNLPHGLWIDARDGGEPTLCVADRANARLQWFDLEEGKHIKTLAEPFILPANVDTHGELMLVPDLSARITLLDKDNKVITLGEDEEWRKEVLKDRMKLRRTPDRWVSGKWVHPHDACFDAEGNIFVAEWVATGRVTKLKKV